MNNFESFTLEHYEAVFEDSRLIVILINTVIIALLSGLIATIIGTLGAIGIVSIKNKKMRNTLLSLNNVLIVSPRRCHRCKLLNFIYNDWCKLRLCFGT